MAAEAEIVEMRVQLQATLTTGTNERLSGRAAASEKIQQSAQKKAKERKREGERNL